MKTVDSKGSYTVGKDFADGGKEIVFEFSYAHFENLADAIENLGGEHKVIAMLNQTHKEDCRNNASSSAKAENGHSVRALLTPEQKEAQKDQARKDRAILRALRDSGKTLEDILKGR